MHLRQPFGKVEERGLCPIDIDPQQRPHETAVGGTHIFQQN